MDQEALHQSLRIHWIQQEGPEGEKWLPAGPPRFCCCFWVCVCVSVCVLPGTTAVTLTYVRVSPSDASSPTSSDAKRPPEEPSHLRVRSHLDRMRNPGWVQEVCVSSLDRPRPLPGVLGSLHIPRGFSCSSLQGATSSWGWCGRGRRPAAPGGRPPPRSCSPPSRCTPTLRSAPVPEESMFTHCWESQLSAYVVSWVAGLNHLVPRLQKMIRGKRRAIFFYLHKWIQFIQEKKNIHFCNYYKCEVGQNVENKLKTCPLSAI